LITNYYWGGLGLDLRIGIMTDRVNPSLGGHSKNIGELGIFLQNAGCKVCYISEEIDPKLKSSWYQVYSGRPVFLKPSFSAAIIAKKIEKEYDIFHGNICYGFPYRFLGKKEYIPHLRTSHRSLIRSIMNDEMWNLDSQLAKTMMILTIQSEIEKFTCRKSRIIVANTPETALSASKDLKIDYNRFRIIPNGIEMPNLSRESGKDIREKMNLRETDRIILYVSRLSLTKGIQRIIQVAEMIIKERKNIMFIIIGSGEVEDKARKMIVSKNLDQCVKLIGHIENERLSAFYSSADLFVVPTSPGTTLIEAMSFGKPFIIYTHESDAPAGVSIEELEKNQLGIILREKPLNELANAILDVIDDEHYLSIMGKKCREYVSSTLGWKPIASRLIKVYEELLSS